jgi:hypothetical protein
MSGGQQLGQVVLDVLAGDEQQLVTTLQRVIGAWHDDTAIAQDRDQRGVGRPLDLADPLAS